MRTNRFKNEKYNKLAKVPHKFAASTEGDSSTITIYGDIGDSWFGESISASDVEHALKGVTSNEIIVRLNSPGGAAFDGIAIYNLLKSHSAKVKIYVDGWACSAASIIAMAADELIMNVGSMMMIHEAATGMWGSKDDFEKEAVVLGKLNESITDIYMTRYTGERSEVEALVNEETWFTATEAAEIGFADKVKEEALPANVAEPETNYEDTMKKMFAEMKKELKNELQPIKEPVQEPAKANLSRLFLNTKK